jgi:hypothetical protein
LCTVGVAAHVATVLAPEVAVILIKEDMEVCDERARRILERALGRRYTERSETYSGTLICQITSLGSWRRIG